MAIEAFIGLIRCRWNAGPLIGIAEANALDEVFDIEARLHQFVAQQSEEFRMRRLIFGSNVVDRVHQSAQRTVPKCG